ncbi:MAG TPA: hypothetical protein VFE24_18415 [Pirellulales bacterium]|jgi:hypothetical protein|nr:hypothetical protein [Pirellulales bacterium]
MELDFAMLALGADNAPSGKLFIFGGAFDAMQAESVPVQPPPIYLISRYLDSSEHPEPHTVAFAIINPLGDRQELKSETITCTKSNNSHALTPATAVVVAVMLIRFENVGLYQFEVSIDGVLCKKIALDMQVQLSS